MVLFRAIFIFHNILLMLIIYILLGFLLLLILLFLGITKTLQDSVPDTFPIAGKIDRSKASGRSVVICIGDSITHGNVGANYVEMLAHNLPQNAFYFINAGRNSDLTYTVLKRLDEIIAYQPDCVTLLIGTNDIQASMSEKNRKIYVRNRRINNSEHPDYESFKKNYKLIVHRLKTETKAKIALASLPIISEDLTLDVNQKADLYSNFIYETSQNEGLEYLSVRENMKNYLQKIPNITPLYQYEDYKKLITLSVLRHLFLRQSWDTICEIHGNQLTHDMLHFNSKGAKIIADLVEDFLNKNSRKI
jgi:lysophospholipase L1-like esterase